MAFSMNLTYAHGQSLELFVHFKPSLQSSYSLCGHFSPSQYPHHCLHVVFLHFQRPGRFCVLLLRLYKLSVWLLEFSVFPPVGTTKMSVEFAAKRPKITALAFVALDGPLSW